MKKCLLLVCLFQIWTIQAQVRNLPMHPIVESRFVDTLYMSAYKHTAMRPFRYNDIPDSLPTYYKPWVTDSWTWNALFNQSAPKVEIQSHRIEILPILSTRFGPIFTEALNYDPPRNLGVQECLMGARLRTDWNEKWGTEFDLGYERFLPTDDSWGGDSLQLMPLSGKAIATQNYARSALFWQGHLSYSPSQYLNFQIGKGKHFWGDGYRSLFISDNAPASAYLSTSVELGRVKYTFMVLRNRDKNGASTKAYNTKYIVAHFLSYNPTKWLNLNFFEAVIQQATDSLGQRGFEPTYLNPFLFLRPAEFNLGSPDNALVGIGGKLRFSPHFQLYAQALIDELIVSELTSNRGWWGNKYALQFGLKYLEPRGIKGLQLQLEANMARPYTYSHSLLADNLGNYYQPMAHPLGANFVELLLDARYQRGRFGISAFASLAEKGLDTEGKNYGGDIYKNYETRTVPDDQRYIPEHWEGTEDFGHQLLQGLRTRYITTELRVYCLLNPQWHWILEMGIRSKLSENEIENRRYTFGFIGFRSALYRATDY